MNLSEAAMEMLNDFKKNTGLLLPITKFLLSNLFLLSLLVIVPLKIAFWIFQLGYLSTFGITYETIQRDVIQAQQLWIDMFIVLSPMLTWVMGLSLTLCVGALLYPPVINYFGLKRLVKSLKTKKAPLKKAPKKPLNKRFMVVYFNRVEKKGGLSFGLAKTSYIFTTIFLVIVVLFTGCSLYVYEQATDIARKKITEFKQKGTCDDGSGQFGCYSLATKTKEYKGFLVATSDESIYLLSSSMELNIVPKVNVVVLSRSNVRIKN